MANPTLALELPPKLSAVIGQRGLEFHSLAEVFEFATKVAASGMAPKSMSRPEQILVAIQTGMEAGLSPMRALSSIYVVGGTPTWKGDAARALVGAAGVLKAGTRVEVFLEIAGKPVETATDEELEAGNALGVCRTWRDGWPAAVRSVFAVSDARRAGLWRKDGPWRQYPQRMLLYRALGIHMREYYGDVLLGLTTSEEAQDIPRAVVNITPARTGPVASPAAETLPAWALEPEGLEDVYEGFGNGMDVYASDFGIHKVVPNRFGFIEPEEPLAASGGPTDSLDALDTVPVPLEPLPPAPDPLPVPLPVPLPPPRQARPATREEKMALSDEIHLRCSTEEDPVKVAVALRAHLRSRFGDSAKMTDFDVSDARAAVASWRREPDN